MNRKLRLYDEERNFFGLVSDAVVTNPFTNKRAELDRQIIQHSADLRENYRSNEAVDEVRRWIGRLEREGRDDFSLYIEPDKLIVRRLFLWEFFHLFSDKFDKHVLEQLQDGGKSLQVTFAKDALSYLTGRGFDREESLRFFTLMFQLRRAYYFIVKNLAGRSGAMRRLRESLWNNVFTCNVQVYNEHLWDRMEDFSTILVGETGTGKGTAASAIGRSGFIPFDEKRQCFVESFAESFITINFSQFPESLIESELFGHKKGAFTGAVTDHEGVFQKCSKHGAIFLDEIGEVSAPVQIKLLKVLEERLFSPVGGHEAFRFDGRIIAATNRTLEEIVSGSVMRKDFYYRLCSDVITVPPLRDRIREDPGELDDLLSVIITKMLGPETPEIVTKVRNLIIQQLGLDYPWPGNVRELAQCVRRMLLNQSYSAPEIASLEPSSKLARDMEKGNIDARDLIKRYCQWLYHLFGNYSEVARRARLDRRTVKKYIVDYIETESN